MKTAVMWWSSVGAAGASNQAIRGNVKGFQDLGHDVDLIYSDKIKQGGVDVSEYDLVLSPFLQEEIYHAVEGVEDTHLHIQIGGFGQIEEAPDRIVKCVGLADTISALDINVPMLVEQKMGLEMDRFKLIPNPPNTDLFSKQDWGDTEGFVLVPKIGSPHKPGDRLMEVANRCNGVMFETHSADNEILVDAVDSIPNNVHVRSPVRFSHMERRYRQSELVLNTAKREGYGNVALEAFMTGRPYVSTINAVAKLFTIPDFDSGDFGSTCEWFKDEYDEQIMDGDHLAIVQDGSRLPLPVVNLINDRDERIEMANRAHDWMDRNFADYTWEDKARDITGLVEVET